LNLLVRLGDGMRSLSGWRRFFCAIALGAFSAFAFAPVEFFPALLLGLVGLALLLDGAMASPHPWRAVAVTGWSFAFGQFLTGMHWIVYPFLVNPALNLWELPIGLPLLQAGLGLFIALGVLPVLAVPQPGPARLLLLAAGYAAAEWLRGHVLTGFPWNLPAYGWGASLAVMQTAALVGAYGLSLLTILLGVSLAELTRRRVLLPGAMILVFAALWSFGALRLAQPTIMVPGVALRLVQPDVPQREMHSRYINRNWQRLLRLSNSPGHPTHIIWPESAAAFPLARVPAALAWIRSLTAKGATLMTGTIRIGEAPQPFTWYNSLYLFGPDGAPPAVYDKSHLVPFGEYVPFAGLLQRLGFTKLTEGESGFSAGDGRHRYAVPGAPSITPLICYEAIFPGAVTAPEGRPGWFVNVTDDSWFGPWAGPAQHLLMARMRTIEEGVPMARAANTGISAVIDGRGRIVGKLGLNQMGVLDAPLPGALGSTLYARLGDLCFVFLLILAIGLAGLAARHARRRA
jgi:apolipoprotein N-acyltransferase